MKVWFIVTLVFFQFNFVAHSSKSNKPNFILVFCDDLGYADIGPFGAKDHSTPALDKMAKEGMKLSDFYSTCPVCTPSRASLMTGCYPRRVNMHVDEKICVSFFRGQKKVSTQMK